MGLGALLTRNIKYDVTNTQTGEKATYTIITDGSPGMYPSWGPGEYRGLTGIPPAWRAMTLISSLLGRVPWVPYREMLGRAPVRIEESVPLLTRPAPGFEPRLNTYRSWALDRLCHGNGLGLVAATSPLGWPTAVTPVSAENAAVARATVQQPIAGFKIGELAYWIGGQWRHQHDVVHFKGPCKPGGLRGMGVVEQHFASIDAAHKLGQQVASVSNAGVPTGVLKTLNPDLTQPEADALKTAWLASQSTRTVAVLGQGVEFEPVAWNPSEVQLNEMRQFDIIQWANIFGIDASYLGGPNPTGIYSNIEGKGIDLLKFGSAGDLIAEFEAALTEYLPRGQYVKANLDFLLRADTTARYQAHAVGIAAGFLHPDEVREYEERSPLTAEQKAELAALRAPAGGAPSTAPAGQGSTQRPGSGAQVAQGANAPRLSAVRGTLEVLERVDSAVQLPVLESAERYPDPAVQVVNVVDVLADDEDVPGWEGWDGELTRAADRSGRNLRAYWTAGPGLAQWVNSPTPWRTLRRKLARYLSGARLDATTSAWYRDVFGHLPGQG